MHPAEPMNDDTDTPQSDAALLHIGWDEHGKECEFVPLKVAREIERDLNEQCVLLGKSAERECALLAKIDRLERELAAVTEQRDRLAKALESVKCELGVPQPEYPSPVANAYWIADEALQSLTTNEL
jgi:hypothetical protein